MIQRTGWEGTALEHDGPIAYAHRGGNLAAPENTMEAFEYAVVELGFAYLETDVHLLADGELAAWHDDTLADDTPISMLTLRDLRAVQRDGYGVAALSDLLEAFPSNRWSIDAKHDAAVEPYLETLRHHNAFGRVILASFSEDSVARLRAGAPAGTPSAMSEQEVGKFWFACMGMPLDGYDGLWHGDIASIPATKEFGDEIIDVVNEQFVEGAHKRSVEVHVWTVNEAKEMSRLLDLGVDGIYTDDPATLKQVFAARGYSVGLSPSANKRPAYKYPRKMNWLERHL